MTMIAQNTFPIATIQNMVGCQKFAKERVDIAKKVKFWVISIRLLHICIDCRTQIFENWFKFEFFAASAFEELTTESLWKTLKDILSPKFTFDPDTHYNNLISSEPYNNDIQKKDNIWGIIRNTLSPKSTDDPETHFVTLFCPHL